MSDTLEVQKLGELAAKSEPLPLLITVDVHAGFVWATAVFKFVLVNTLDRGTNIAQGTVQVDAANGLVRYYWHGDDLDQPGVYEAQLWVKDENGDHEPTNLITFTVAERTPDPFEVV